MAKKKNYLPKRIAGVKVPKSIRRGRLARLIASPLGQEILAEAVVAAAGAALSSQAKQGSATRRSASKTRQVAGEALALTGESVVLLSYALRTAARTFRRALLEGPPQATARLDTP